MPNYEEAYSNLGALQTQMGKSSQALKNFIKARDINPHTPVYHFNVANAHQTLEQWKEAVSSYQHVVQLNHKDMAAYTNLGVCYTQLGEKSLAFDALMMALELEPKNIKAKEALTDLGELQPE